MTFPSESKLFLGMFLATAAIVGIAVFAFSRPAKPLAKDVLILSTTNTRGPQDAPVWLVEFSCFLCPACKIFSEAIDEIAAKYPDKLLITYRYFPLPQHTEAIPAAIVAEAAAIQGKFWEMERALFDNQSSLSATLYPQLAASIGLDMEAFEKARKDPVIKSRINADKQAGATLRIRATPTFFLNGRMLTVASPDDLIEEVEMELKK